MAQVLSGASTQRNDSSPAEIVPPGFAFSLFQAHRHFRNVQLDSKARLVALTLAGHADRQARCWPSIATLVRETSLSERSVQQAIRRLEDAGLVVRRTRKAANGNQTSNLYVLTFGLRPVDSFPKAFRDQKEAAPASANASVEQADVTAKALPSLGFGCSGCRSIPTERRDRPERQRATRFGARGWAYPPVAGGLRHVAGEIGSAGVDVERLLGRVDHRGGARG